MDVSEGIMARNNKKFESRQAKDYSSYSTAGNFRYFFLKELRNIQAVAKHQYQMSY